MSSSPTTSRAVRWRPLCLAAAYLLIVAHVLHWKLAGRTLTSIQLSEAGRFAAEGVATAAFFYFAILTVITMVFGRFFCAWACHMLAVQEGCRWLLARLRIRPRPLRVRALRLAPFAAAFYIFLFPVAQRLWLGVPFPTPQIQLTTDHMWATLPSPWSGVFTLIVCGLLLVYFLGSLSFCKYVCPYSAVFAIADRLAPGRIRLTGECDGCAKCSAACTTGVRVHAEVQQRGAVTNSGCMRCLECVNACPRQALAYRFGRPALFQPPVTDPRYDFTLAEEAVLLGLGVATFVALNGLYDAVPLLLAMGLSLLVAYFGVVAVRLVRESAVSLRGVALKDAGRLSRAGGAFAMAMGLMLVLVGHALLMQYHHRRAAAVLDGLGFPRLAAFEGRARTEAVAAVHHLTMCTRYGLTDTFDWNMKLAWLARGLADSDAVEQHLRRAIARDPRQPVAHFNLGKELARQGRRDEAVHAFTEAIHLDPKFKQFVPRPFVTRALGTSAATS